MSDYVWQVTPPLMGAGAFQVAEYTWAPYLDILKVSIFLALLCFGTVYLFVNSMAARV